MRNSMRRAFIIVAALIFIFSVAWGQDSQPVQEKPQAAQQHQPQQQPRDVKYANDSVAPYGDVWGPSGMSSDWQLDNDGRECFSHV